MREDISNKVPNGQTQPQKKRPMSIVNDKVINPKETGIINSLLAIIVAREISGSKRKNRSGGTFI
jgi:hypothetical protein